MLNELKKIYSEAHVKLFVLIVAIFTIIIPIVSINSYTTLKSFDDNEIVSGKEAYKIVRERYANYKGELSIDKLNASLDVYQSEPSEDLAYLKATIEYPGIINLLMEGYTSMDAENGSRLSDISNANDFYSKNVVKIEESLAHSSTKYYPWEKKIIIEKATAIETPYIIDFSRQWVFGYKILSFVFIIIFFSAIVIASKIFSYEKEKNMDMILATVNSKQIVKIGKHKIYALLTFLSVEYGISVIILSLIFFLNTGISAWSSQIQLEYFTSIYKITFGEMHLLCLIIGWVCVIAIGSIVAFINVIIQRSYITLMMGFITVLLPLVVTRLNLIPTLIKRFFLIQPINGFLIEKNLLSLHIYKIGPIAILSNTAIIIYSFLIIVLCILSVPHLFSIRIKDR